MNREYSFEETDAEGNKKKIYYATTTDIWYRPIVRNAGTWQKPRHEVAGIELIALDDKGQPMVDPSKNGVKKAIKGHLLYSAGETVGTITSDCVTMMLMERRTVGYDSKTA